jgi:hypothetical protein
MIEVTMRAFSTITFTCLVPLLVCALAFGQGEQSTTSQPTAAQPAAGEQANAPASVKPRPTTPASVADAARASKQAQQAMPPGKVYRNKDVKDPAAASSDQNAVATAPAVTKTAAETTDDQIKKDRAFEAQALVFKSQIRVEKSKVVDIQNRMKDLKYQFDAWSTEFAQDSSDAQACWTSQYYTPYYKDWCDRGRDLKAQYDATQAQLNQEKVRLEQMQENIRRKGYGNGVYDAD